MFKKIIGFQIALVSICVCLFLVSYDKLIALQSKGHEIASHGANHLNALSTIQGGGVILSFDDQYVLEWYDVDRVLSKYNWKATFFVCRFNLLDEERIDKLIALQSKGHEIASHGANHLNAVKFISSHSIDEYIETEILPSIHAMNNKGLVVSSFAYPYGARNKQLDKILLRYFKMIKGTTYGVKAGINHKAFANGSRVVFGLGIDRNYGNDMKWLLEMLEYAKENNKIVIFYGHRVAPGDTSSKYTTNYTTLETICQYIVKNNMRFLTMKDLLPS